MTTKLKSHAVRPFEGGWDDWIASEDGENGVVTFVTLDHHLYDEVFFNNCVSFETPDGRDHSELDIDEWMETETERKVDVTQFNPDDIQQPGAYKDEQGERLYTVILPYNFMASRLVQEWLGKLNDKFDEDFELWKDCIHCGEEVQIGEHYEKRKDASYIKRWGTHGMVFCSKTCFQNFESLDSG